MFAEAPRLGYDARRRDDADTASDVSDAEDFLRSIDGDASRGSRRGRYDYDRRDLGAVNRGHYLGDSRVAGSPQRPRDWARADEILGPMTAPASSSRLASPDDDGRFRLAASALRSPVRDLRKQPHLVLHDVKATWSPDGELVRVDHGRGGSPGGREESPPSALARSRHFGAAPALGDHGRREFEAPRPALASALAAAAAAADVAAARAGGASDGAAVATLGHVAEILARAIAQIALGHDGPGAAPAPAPAPAEPAASSPADALAAPGAAAAPAPAPAPAADAWTAQVDPGSGATYYRNEATGEVSWTDPTAAAAPAGAAAADWVEAVDPGSGATYYTNSATGETSWTKPDDAAAAAAAPAGDWAEAVDPSSGATYYTNAATGETSWTKPTDYASAEPADSEWAEQTDPSTGAVYYLNMTTGESAWTKP